MYDGNLTNYTYGHLTTKAGIFHILFLIMIFAVAQSDL